MVLCLNLVATKRTSYNHVKVIYLSLHFRLPCALKDTTMACSSPTLRVSSLGVTEKLSSLSLHCKQEWRQTAKEKWFQLNEQQKRRNVQWKGKEKKQEHKEIKKVRKKEKLKVEVEKAKKKKERKKKAKYQWIPAVFATIWAQNVTEAYPNPRSNKKSKGQNYLEFQLHINVSCIL